MLDLIDYESIRRLHNKGMSIREISAKLGHCRKTIRKVLKWDGSVPKYKLTEPRPAPKVTTQVVEFVRAILVADKAAPRKQRHTSHRIFRRLQKEMKYSGSESGVRRLAAKLKAELGNTKRVTTPLSFEAGEETQVDWGYAQVTISGLTVKACLLYLTLCYSRRTFVMAFPAEKQECFLEGHLLAFEHFGGTTSRYCYDNLSSAVKKVFLGSTREENSTFLRFRTYYGFDVRYCTPGIKGAHEKGRVESRVGSFRRRFLVPVPKFESWDGLNAYLLRCCREWDSSVHPRQADVSIEDAFLEEAPRLRPLPPHRFSCCRVDTVRADGQARISYDGVTYSLPCRYGRCRVEIRAYFNRIEVFHRQKVVCCWARSFCKGKEFYDYRHYIPLLAKAPGASLNGKPYQYMPPELIWYREELLARRDRRVAARAMAQVLKLCLEFTESDVVDAVELALLCGTVDPDAVKNLVLQMRGDWTTPAEPLKRLALPPEVREVAVTPRTLAPYDQLLEATL